VDDTIRYTDAELAARWATPRIELGAVVGARAGRGLPTVAGSASAWGSLSATIWLNERLAVVAGAGSYPVDFTQGFPGGRFISAGVRMTIGRSERGSSSAAPRRGNTGAAGRGETSSASESIAAFTVEHGTGVEVTLRVRAPAASRVEVAGDFTSWEVVPFTRSADGWWVVTLPIPGATHQLNVRLDRSAWLVPPGLPTITDESGSTGLLVISR
jgi:hypothetical protein